MLAIFVSRRTVVHTIKIMLIEIVTSGRNSRLLQEREDLINMITSAKLT